MQLGFEDFIHITMAVGFLALLIWVVVFLRDFVRMQSRMRALELQVQPHGAPSSGESAGDDGVDPLAEAEVYVAGGHRDMAIQILEAALQANPTRVQVHKRLAQLKGGQ